MMYGNITEFGGNTGNAYINAYVRVDHYFSVGSENIFLTPTLTRSDTVCSFANILICSRFACLYVCLSVC